jgi:NTP pyrophosphatase (non-canonical NTP hydrolase)
MEIEEIQKRISEVSEKRQIIKRYKNTPELSFIHLTEELGEIGSQLFSKQARKDRFDIINLKEEVCDAILESLVLADLLDINLSEELNNKINKLQEKYP